MDQVLERLHDRVDKIEDKQQRHAEEFAQTKVYVKEIYKKMNDIAIALELMKLKSNTRMERFIEKLLWVVIGIAGTYIATKLK